MGGQVTDFLSALRAYLLGQSEVVALVSKSVYVLALPKEELDLGPHAVVVLLSSGGNLGKVGRTTAEARVDVVCYGATDFEAMQLDMVVSESIKWLNREYVNGVLLHNASVAGGPFQARDPEIFWPCMRRQTLIRADERKVG
jgi:hypothetical protein